MDGYFDYDGKKIGYKIVDDNSPIKNVNGVEKTSRFFHFFDGDKNLGFISVYDSTDKLFNLTHYIVKDYYEKNFLKQ